MLIRVLLLLLIVLSAPEVLFALEVELTWEPNTEADLEGYKLYYSSRSQGLTLNGTGAVQGDSPVSVGNVSLARLSGLVDDQIYFISVTAYNKRGIESVPSNVVFTSGIQPTGDLDGSGIVTVLDAQIAQKIAVGKIPAEPEHLVWGDVAPLINTVSTPDGRIDTGDVIVILNRMIAIPAN